jgi:4-carboxymuconolactone decarboxylase
MPQDKEPSGAAKRSGTSRPPWWASPTMCCSGRSGSVRSCRRGTGAWSLVFHLGLAKRNGVTEQELIEAITHLAFYAGWPKAMSAMTVAKKVFRSS